MTGGKEDAKPCRHFRVPKMFLLISSGQLGYSWPSSPFDAQQRSKPGAQRRAVHHARRALFHEIKPPTGACRRPSSAPTGTPAQGGALDRTPFDSGRVHEYLCGSVWVGDGDIVPLVVRAGTPPAANAARDCRQLSQPRRHMPHHMRAR